MATLDTTKKPRNLNDDSYKQIDSLLNTPQETNRKFFYPRIDKRVPNNFLRKMDSIITSTENKLKNLEILLDKEFPELNHYGNQKDVCIKPFNSCIIDSSLNDLDVITSYDSNKDTPEFKYLLRKREEMLKIKAETISKIREHLVKRKDAYTTISGIVKHIKSSKIYETKDVFSIGVSSDFLFNTSEVVIPNVINEIKISCKDSQVEKIIVKGLHLNLEKGDQFDADVYSGVSINNILMGKYHFKGSFFCESDIVLGLNSKIDEPKMGCEYSFLKVEPSRLVVCKEIRKIKNDEVVATYITSIG